MSGQLSIIERARIYLQQVPPAVSGSGGHEHTLLTTRAIVRGFLIPEGDALVLLEEWNQRNEEKWSVKELEHKIRSVQKGPPPRKGDGYLLDEADERPQEVLRRDAPRVEAVKPEYDVRRLTEFAGDWANVVDLCWLADRSVVEPCGVTSGDLLGHLYRADRGERVLVFVNEWSQGDAVWPEEALPEAGSEGVWFLGQPVDGEYRPNPRSGNMSRRSEESVMAWRYMLLESDDVPVRLWLGALVQLPLRIAAIYTSAGRSVHALVRVDARTKREWDGMKHALIPGLVTLGADDRAITAVRLTRLPGCWRNGKRDKSGKYVKFPHPRLQKLLYVNPDPAARPLAEVLPRRDVAAKWLAEVESVAKAGVGTVPLERLQDVTEACGYYAPVCRALGGHYAELAEVLEMRVAAGKAA